MSTRADRSTKGVQQLRVDTLASDAYGAWNILLTARLRVNRLRRLEGPLTATLLYSPPAATVRKNADEKTA